VERTVARVFAHGREYGRERRGPPWNPPAGRPADRAQEWRGEELMIVARMTAAVLVFLAAAAPLTIHLAVAQENADPQIQTMRLGEKVIIVTDGGMGSQLAVNSRDGIVVFDTGWCTRVAKALRRQIEQEFQRSDMAAVVLTNQRLDFVGGGGAYEGTPIIAHERVRRVLARQKESLQPHLQPLIDMWRWKEDVSRQRLPNHAAGSQEARTEENWMNTCKRMADGLSSDYALVLPTRTFDDRLSLDLGDMTLELEYFGVGSRGEAGLVARIPELKLVLFGRLLFHEQHLLPYLNAMGWQDLDVPRTLGVLDEILADEANVETVVVTSGPWPLEEIKARRRYMGDLWREVESAVKQGKSLEQMQQELTVDGRFAYVKDWQVWKDSGAEWCTMEHTNNVERFWGQFQKYAAREVFHICQDSGTEAALAKYAEFTGGQAGGYIVDGISFDSLAESLFYDGYVDAAEAVARRNVQSFPDEWPVHRRMGEKLLAEGDNAGALAAFRRVLELDPQNAQAKQKIEELQ
jgi:hypothetical protein